MTGFLVKMECWQNESQTSDHHSATPAMYILTRHHFPHHMWLKNTLFFFKMCIMMLSFLLPLLQCNRIPEERRYTLPLKSVYMKQIDHMVGLFWIRRCQQHKQGFSTHLPQVQMQWDSKGSTAGQTLVAQVLVSKGKLKLTWISSSMSGCIKSGSWEALLLGNWQSSRELLFFFFYFAEKQVFIELLVQSRVFVCCVCLYVYACFRLQLSC